MKIFFFKILFVILSAFITHAQSPSVEWQRCYGGTSPEEAFDINKLSNGYIISGWTLSNNGDVTFNHGSGDGWVLQINLLGDILWQKSYGGTNGEEFLSVNAANDGGFVVAGRTSSNNGDVSGFMGGGTDRWVVKLDALGNIAWQNAMGGAQGELGGKVKHTRDGGYISSGTTQSNNGDVSGSHGSVECWIVKQDGAGNIQWQKTLGGSGADYANDIQVCPDGGFIVAGSSNSQDGDVSVGYPGLGRTPWVVKLDSLGNIIWEKTYGSRVDPAIDEEFSSVTPTNDGGYILAGYCGAEGGNVSGYHGGEDYWVVKLDSMGNFVWQKTLGGSGDDLALCVRQTFDGGYVVFGSTSSNDFDVTGNHGNADCWLVKLSPTGNPEWQKCFGGNMYEEGRTIEQTADGGFIIGGLTESNNNGDVGANHGSSDWWIAKLSPAGPVPVTLIKFDAIAGKQGVECRWRTEQETNSSHFEVERSVDAMHFNFTGRKDAAGTSSSPQQYYFTDETAFNAGKDDLYYRLHIVDKDGSSRYSPVVKVNLTHILSLNVFPNPAKEEISVSFHSSVKEKGVTNIIDYSGRKLYSKAASIIKGNNSFILNVSDFPAGEYVITIEGINQFSGQFIIR